MGLVVGIGSVGQAAAETFGGHTGRSVLELPGLCHLSSALEAAGPIESAMLFVDEAQYSLDLCVELVEIGASLDLPVGILPLPSDVRAAEAAARRLIRLRSASRSEGIAFYCDFSAGPPGGLRVGYGREQAQEFLELLEGSGLSAAVLHCHGNGADFRLGRRALCVQADTLSPPPPRPGEHSLSCQAGGPCRLEHKGMQELVGASRIRADIIVLLSCMGVAPSDGVLPWRFLLAHALLRGEWVQAVLASYRINTNSPSLGVATTTLLAQGCPLGQLAANINSLSPAGGCYLCLGDPELSILVEGATERAPERPSEGPPLHTDHRVTAAHLLCCADLVLASPGPSRQESEELIEALRASAAACLRGPVEREAIIALDERMVRWCASRLTQQGGELRQLWDFCFTERDDRFHSRVYSAVERIVVIDGDSWHDNPTAPSAQLPVRLGSSRPTVGAIAWWGSGAIAAVAGGRVHSARRVNAGDREVHLDLQAFDDEKVIVVACSQGRLAGLGVLL